MATGSDDNIIEVKGLILESAAVGEADRRVEILTKERGRISAFVQNARRVNKSGNLMATASPFVFGTFRIYEGSKANRLREVIPENYFTDLKKDYVATCYGYYFMELLKYVTRENADASAELILAYQSLRALESASFDNRLVRCIFELKMIMLEGEYPGPERGVDYRPATLYTLEYLWRTPVVKLFSFSVTEDVLQELIAFSNHLVRKTFRHEFVSLQVLDVISRQ